MIEVKLSRIMGDRRINQSQLAKRTGIRPNTISELYADFADRVSLDQLDRICDALECDLSELLVYTPKAQKIRKKWINIKPIKSETPNN